MKSFYLKSLFFLWCLMILTANIYAQRYVKPVASGSGDGSSWANASNDLQAMINASAVGEAVWVAAGTYKPAAYPIGCIDCNTNRDFTFYIKDGVKVYGGFAGTEVTLAERNITANTVILSGDIGMTNDSTDNCYHVVCASAVDTNGIGITLDGFTVTEGNADGSTVVTVGSSIFNRAYGGGIYVRFGSNTIINNTVINDHATLYGGGIFLRSGANTVTNNTFSGNKASSGGGIATFNGIHTIADNTSYGNTANFGGSFFVEASVSTIHNNTIYGNVANTSGAGIFTLLGINTLTNNNIYENTANYGGGIYAQQSTNTLTDNTVSENTVTFWGGGIYISNGTDTLINNVFSENTAVWGGGVYIDGGINTLIGNTASANTVTVGGGGMYIGKSTSTLQNNIVDENTARSGGGIYIQDSSSTLVNNTFSGNTATYIGGGLYTYDSNTTLWNNTFVNNHADTTGGAIRYVRGTHTAVNNLFYGNTSNIFASVIGTSSNATYTLYNNTFANNSAPSQGTTIYNFTNSNCTLKNNIFWNNTKGGSADVAEADIINDGGTVVAFEYCLLQSNSAYSANTGNLSQDPLFNNAASGDFTLQNNSPCINAGNNATWTATTLTTDAAGNPRPYGIVDMGAYENQVILVASSNNLSTITQEVLLYPNPVTSYLTIEDGEGTATLFNAIGQPLRQFNVTDSKYLLNTNELPKGVYTLQIRKTDGTAVVKQFVK